MVHRGGLAGIGGVFRGADTMLVPPLDGRYCFCFAVVILGALAVFMAQ